MPKKSTNTALQLLAAEPSLERPAAAIRVLGIDLGTTNSAIAEIVYEGGRPHPECLEVTQPTDGGEYTNTLVPSVVATTGGTVVVGEGAKRMRPRLNAMQLQEGRDIFWDTKNDMGLLKTYQRAPEGFRSARDIAKHVISFLHESALERSDHDVQRTVVTVPASFNLEQRRHTCEAAASAGLDVMPGDLLDEPYAAFFDHVWRKSPAALARKEHLNVVIFDFGGGTCDVAVLRTSTRGNAFGMAPLSVSRYHRLGGGDIDNAIVHEVLLPALSAENGLAPGELTFKEKKRIAQQLLGTAEALKIGLCSELHRRRSLDLDLSGITKRQPQRVSFTLANGRVVYLDGPELTSEKFSEILVPFLDEDLLLQREDEYRMTCSIFAPLTDALRRAHLERNEVDLCLLVGGSSLIPQVQDAVDAHFTNAELVTSDSPEEVQAAVARGASLHALALALTGRGLVEPLTGDSLHIMTKSGARELIPSGAVLPFPSTSEWAENHDLVVPPSSSKQTNLRVKLVDGDGREIVTKIWPLGYGLAPNARLLLRYRIDENRTLHLEGSLVDSPEETFSIEYQSPFVNVVYPDTKREKIAEIEENLRTAAFSPKQKKSKVVEVARLTRDLGQFDKAFDWYKAAHGIDPDDPSPLLAMGSICGDRGDHEREEKFLRACARITDSGAPLFNLAYGFHRRKQHAQALSAIEEAIGRESTGPELTLKAMILDSADRKPETAETLDSAISAFPPLNSQSDFELGYYLVATKLANDTNHRAEAEEERRRRNSDRVGQPGVGFENGDHLLPDIAPNLERRSQ